MKKFFERSFWVMLAVGIVLGIIYGVGAFLPENYIGEAERVVDGSPVQVWEAIADSRKHPLTGSYMKSIRDLPPENGLACWVEDIGTYIGNSEVTVRTIESTDTNMVRTLEDSVVQMTSVWRYEVQSSARGSRVQLRQKMSLKSGTWQVPIFRLVMSAGGPKSGLEEYLDGLEARFAK